MKEQGTALAGNPDSVSALSASEGVQTFLVSSELCERWVGATWVGEKHFLLLALHR